MNEKEEKPNKKYIRTSLEIGALILVLALIWIISNVPSNETNMQTAICIATQTELYVSKTCSHCAQQKEMLKDYIGLFKVTDCIDNSTLCVEKGISKVPTWEINNQTYPGYKNWKELSELTGCDLK